MRSWIHRVVYALERKLFLGPQRVFGNPSDEIVEVDRSCTLYRYDLRIFTILIMRSWIHRVVYALERKLFLGPQRVFGNPSGGIVDVDRSCTLYSNGFRILRS